MTFWSFVITIIVPIVISAGVTYYLNEKYEKARRKRKVVSDLIAYRNGITPTATPHDREQFFPQLNRLIVEFDDVEVNTALRNFLTALLARNQNLNETTVANADNMLNKLLELLLKKVDINNIKANDDLIQNPFRAN